jgi:peptidyl-prolyl cis-trans isomerase C
MVLRLDMALRASYCAAAVGTLGVALLFAVPGCSKKKSETGAVASASASAGKKTLSPELAKKTLAKVGDRVITLGEYAATLDRMDPFERMRYQSQDRRKRLLDEMIEVELLSQEARRRGLDKAPETQERLRQLLRDQMLEEVRKSAPAPNDVPEPELRAYYDKHKDEFAEPERRRVAGIVLENASLAKTVLAQALKATPAAWGELVEQRSTQRGSRSAIAPSELAGDLGIVGPPGHARGANPRVPEPVRDAVFKIAKVGDTYSEVVPSDGKFYVIRLMSTTPPRERKYEDSERAIRTAVVQAKIREKEQALEAELRKKFPVTVDDAALAKMPMPPPNTAAQQAPVGKPDMRMLPTLGSPPRLAVPPTMPPPQAPAPPPPAPPKAP